MIYIHYSTKNGERFVQLEGKTFEITELNIFDERHERTNDDWTYYRKVDFTIKTDLGEKKDFELDIGYRMNSYTNDKQFHLHWLVIITDTEKTFLLNKDNKTDFDMTVYNYFKDKIKPATDLIQKEYLVYKKQQEIKKDFED